MTQKRAHCGVIMLMLTAFGCGGQGFAGDEAVAQDAPTASDAVEAESLLAPDSLMSRDDWKRRIVDARKRADQARSDWKLMAPLRSAILPDPPEKIASQRVLNDDTLRPGDIVSTDKGLLLFLGRLGPDGEAAEFVPIAPR